MFTLINPSPCVSSADLMELYSEPRCECVSWMNLSASALVIKEKHNRHRCSSPVPPPPPPRIPCKMTLSPFCCFAACVDVYGTHSNVHLSCFHTGKSTAVRAAPSPRTVSSPAIDFIISVILNPHPLCHSAFRLRDGWPPFYLSPDDISVLIIIVIQISFCLTDLFHLHSITISGREISCTQL